MSDNAGRTLDVAVVFHATGSTVMTRRRQFHDALAGTDTVATLAAATAAPTPDTGSLLIERNIVIGLRPGPANATFRGSVHASAPNWPSTAFQVRTVDGPPVDAQAFGRPYHDLVTMAGAEFVVPPIGTAP